MIKDAFFDYFKELLGAAESEQFFSSIRERKTRRSVRVNTLKCEKEFLREWLSGEGYEVSDNPFSGDVLDISGSGKPLALKLPYHAGFTYPQDSSSCFAVELLDPKPGETVLDLTAAPGGKSSHMAQKMQNRGVMISNDMDSKRLKALHSNFERLGVWNALVMRMMPHKMAGLYPETFDKILLDPSCSGEGLLVTEGGKPDFWSPKAMKRYASEQYGLLRSAFALLKPGGRLVYSTCTLNKIENDGVALRLLEEFPQAQLDSFEHVKAFMPEQIPGLMGIRFWPHRTGTKGFFCIAIKKTESLGVVPNLEGERLRLVKDVRPYLKSLEEFGWTAPDVNFVEMDHHLYMVSKELSGFPLPKGFSLSFPLLKVYENDFRLTHAGAVLLGQTAKKKILDLSFEEAQAIFDRKPLERGGEPGAYLARYKKFPLGLARQSEKRLEVHMPRQY